MHLAGMFARGIWRARIARQAVYAAFLAATLSATAGTEDPNNWPQYNRTHDNWRYSPLSQVNKSNVKRLKLAWIHQSPETTGGLQETPIVIDGIIYHISANNRVAAIDGTSGKEIWTYAPKLNPLIKKALFSPYSRGVAVGRGKVFIGTVDGRGIALDQKSGKELWQVQLTDFENCQGCNFTSPPVLAGSVLTFGSTGGELASASKIFGVDPDSGKRLWDFDTIKQDDASWPGESKKYGGGGAWMPGTYDPKTDTVYYGTGNPARDFWPTDRMGDNLYTDSIVALDPKTGKLKWHHQEVKNDHFDFDSIYEVMLLNRNGKDLAVHLNKGGFVSVLDQHSGKVQNVWPLAQSFNWVKGLDPKTGDPIEQMPFVDGKPRVQCPAPIGARSWQAGSYSPKTGLWYTNAMEICAEITPFETKLAPQDFGAGHVGAGDFGRNFVAPGQNIARLDARDPITGKRKWVYEFDNSLGYTAVLSTGGDLVFNGDVFGMLRAHDAETGKVLWTFNTGSGMRSGIVTYAVKGKQFVLVPSGWGSWASLLLPQVLPAVANVPSAATLLAFTIED